MDEATYETLKWELELSGYAYYINPIDYEVATSYPCSDCGGIVEGEGFRKGDSYRAFAVCQKCGQAYEF